MQNAAGGTPAAQRGDLVLQIVCPYFVEPHTAAGIVGIFAQRLQTLIAVLRSYLTALSIIYDLDYGRNGSFIVSA